MNGFGSESSDVDMCLLIKHTEMDQRNEAIYHLDHILRSLNRCGKLFFSQLKYYEKEIKHFLN